MPSKNQAKPSQTQTLNQPIPEPDFILTGDHLARFLQSLREQIATHRNSDKSLPEKLWVKRQFAVGVNEVTRILERMPPSTDSGPGRKLQVVLVAADCNPRWLTRHLPNLAASRDVKVIGVKDNKRGSLRLGEIVGVKTAIAIGVKVRGSCVNEFLRRVVDGEGDEFVEPTQPKV